MQEFEARALIPAEPALNVADLLAQRVQRAPEAPLFARPDGDGWRDVSGAAFLAEVVALAKGFVAAGIGPGERIGLLASTRYEWTLVDFAAWYAGAFVVPIYETSAPEQVRWILGDSGCCAVIVETAEHFTRVDEVRADLDDVREVWQLGLGDLDKLAEGGRDVSDEEIERRRQLATESDIATIIYTAGTTGRPKGCVLTHGNFVELARNTTLAIPEVVNGNASTLLFITLAHVFARFIAVLAVHGGVKVGHQADTSKLLPALGSFRPTFLLAVPRVFEKVYNSAEQKAEAGGKGKIFRWAADTGIAYSEARDAGHVPVALSARFAVANALVFRTLRKALGGRVEWAVSGSAPLGKRLGHFYRAMGVTILEGYGLTETTAPATVNRPSKFKIGTVGPVLPGISVRIADDGEIEIRGIDVFREYWHNEQATADAFDDGWFRTGDIGTFDEDGYLTITGRKKEIIVTAGGKNVAPAELEDPIRANPIVSQVVVVGDGRPFIAALVTLDADMLPAWLENHGQDRTLSPAKAAELPLVRDEIQSAIDHANTRVSRAEGIRAFEILPDDFTEAAGQLTPKLSVKRHVVLEQCAERIERLYADAKAKRQGASAH
ncbi:MAG TPA: long-chain fatty acid--CoA ligase [Amnibacterium sp.]|uniref:AMP-dependent synthetase/ligase n=1 Tax=Amnibacterium sp. TaxID=1872496 RepID=UPI002F95AA57